MSLKDIPLPFNPASEEDVRVALALYFRDLGFSLAEMSFEDSFTVRLGHTSIVFPKRLERDEVHGRSDMLLVRNGRPLAIVETKAPDIGLTDKDRDQALSYARLLREMPPYTVVTNGQEVRVYDTLSAELIQSGSPAESAWWRNGGTFSGLGSANHEWAIHTLFSLNFDVLRQYCSDQVSRSMSNLKGAPLENRRYSPTLYIPRTSSQGLWESFLASDYLCLAFVGDSGIGKTNELCVRAEMAVQDRALIALFYRGIQLVKGLGGAIQNDFEWEYEREEPVARIIRRFAELAQPHQSRLIIFVDGLDEYPASLQRLRAELIDLASRLDPNAVRLCLSCKSHDWETFVRERGSGLNLLGEKVFPAVGNQKELPGVHLGVFDDQETDQAWEKYREQFGVEGELLGETRQECQMPLLMRFVAETYANSDQSISPSLSNLAILDHYWERKTAEFDRQEQLTIERIIGEAAEAMVRLNQAELDESEFSRSLDANLATAPAYAAITRFGFLVRQYRSPGKTFLTFPFEKLRAYVYVAKARRWQDKRSGTEIAEEIQLVLSSRFGCDALRFYFGADARVTGWLTPLIGHDPALFIKAVREIEDASAPEPPIDEKARAIDVNYRLERFIETYSLLRGQVPGLKERLAPYTDGEAGFWVFGNWHGYRTLTPQCPQYVLELDGRVFQEIRSGALTEETVQAVRPSNIWVHSDMPWSVLARKPAEVVAFTEFKGQLIGLLKEQFLDESLCPVILAERVHHTLAHEPSISVGVSLPGHYWQLLGYSSLEQAQAAPCAELFTKTTQLTQAWLAQTQMSEGYPKHFYDSQLPTLMLLTWNLIQLEQHADHLPAPGPSYEAMFSYLRSGSLQKTAGIALDLAPLVIESFGALVQRNLSRLASEFATYQHLGSRLLLEIFKDESTPLQSDYLNLSYVWLPSAPPGPATIRIVSREESLAERFIRNRRVHFNIFAHNVELATEVDGHVIEEKNAVISRIRYPSHLPVSDQVYQLVANEADRVFGDHFEWFQAQTMTGIDPKRVMQLLARRALPKS